MSVKQYFKRALELPPHIVFLKAVKLFKRTIHAVYRRQYDRLNNTYFDLSKGELARILKLDSITRFNNNYLEINELAKLYLNHYFDLLGSGWVQVYHGTKCKGIEGSKYGADSKLTKNDTKTDEVYRMRVCINKSNRSKSKDIMNLITPDYVPIDWQLDFKSGYRWVENQWYQHIPYAHKPGVDIKVPWELARMQHLPQLAFAYLLSKENKEGFLPREEYKNEYCNQILDFIGSNPPRYGVNWKCTMDVAIRISNWLISYDLFKAFGAEFDQRFEATLLNSIYDHGYHIINNLEWDPDLRGNHYLSDIVGLLFVAAYLPSTTETDNWLQFAMEQFFNEVYYQFNEEGSNFEASTSYHRLSAEMVVYATALILGLPEARKAKAGKDFPDWFFERLERMAEFTMHITKPDGSIIQIGDNDSGRFLKIHPVFDKDIRENDSENILDHRHLVSAINAIIPRDDFEAFVGSQTLDAWIIEGLSQGTKLQSYTLKSRVLCARNRTVNTEEAARVLPLINTAIVDLQDYVSEFLSAEANLTDNISSFAYPEFGLYIYRSDYLYLAVRCGSIGQNNNGGHSHQDQLHIELSMNGNNIIRDPGTYLYTPLPVKRNFYRKASAHYCPSNRIEKYKSILAQGLFTLKGYPAGRVLLFNETVFLGYHDGNYCFIEISPQAVKVLDFQINNGQLLPINKRQINCEIQFSSGYGRLG